MQKMTNLQEEFLNCARKERVLMTVFLTNGFQMKGTVKAYDNFTIILDVEGRQQLIYKHAVSTIIPARSIQFGRCGAEREVVQVE